MSVANPTDPSLSLITYTGTPGPSSAYAPRSAAHRSQSGRLLAFAGVILASTIAAFGAGYAAGGSATADVAEPRPAVMVPISPTAMAPKPGEFRLGPGLAQPPGIVVPLLSTAMRPSPGEFRLSPGNLEPVGVVEPLR